MCVVGSRYLRAENECLASTDCALAFDRRKTAALDLFYVAQLARRFAHNAVA
jgi:hypothetical protein